MVIGSFFGPIAAGYAHDVQGSYQMIFNVIAVLNLDWRRADSSSSSKPELPGRTDAAREGEG